MRHSVKPLGSAERKLAEVAARVIAKAEEIGLPDAPEKLVTTHALRLLARAHVELHDQVRALHDLVDQTRLTQPPEGPDLHTKLWQPLDSLDLTVRAGNVLMNIGVSYVGDLVQLDRRALLSLKNCGKRTLREIEEKLALHTLFLGSALDGWPGPRWECIDEWPYYKKIGPTLVRSDLPMVQVKMTSNSTQVARDTKDLVALYCRVMSEVAEIFVKHETYVVRQWDGMDGCWTDCTGEVGREEALHVWAKRTDDGTRRVAYTEIDYCRIFPGGTRMHWDGAEGREMHR